MHNKLTHWRIDADNAGDNADNNYDEFSQDACWLTLASGAQSGGENVLSRAVLTELELALGEIEQINPRMLIIRAARNNNAKHAREHSFIAGADVGEFGAIQNYEHALQLVTDAHRIFARLEGMPMPTAALIDGHCLGGGLELALACDYRIALHRPQIRIGLPEVRLGIHPGFGGSARLIDTIGAPAALALMLRGRTVSPKRAARLGIVDYAVPVRQLLSTARYVFTAKPRPRRARGWRKWANIKPAREVIAYVLHNKIARAINPRHYPAPFALLELWRRHGGQRAAMLSAERESVARLIVTPTARNLARVLSLREQLKQDGIAAATRNRRATATRKFPGQFNPGQFNPGQFNHVHIIGAGVMGGDIAAWCAYRGLTATIHDQDARALGAATARAYKLFQRKLTSPRLVERAMDRFHPDPHNFGVRAADVVIEAIAEDADAKMTVLDSVQRAARGDALLATNTSSSEIDTWAAALESPGRLGGWHFFNPVAAMQLVEVVRGDTAQPKTMARAAAFVAAIGRLPLRVNSIPGFLVNRVLAPYLIEAVMLLDEGCPRELIDRAAVQFGMPVGPLQLADRVGLDICAQVANGLGASLADRVPALLHNKIQAGQLGRKSGEGFYQWAGGKIKSDKFNIGGFNIGRLNIGRLNIDMRKSNNRGADLPPGVADRLIFTFLNETVACLQAGVVADADAADAGLIFGAGFAPHRGGPLRYIAAQGVDNMLWKMSALQEQYGARFQPARGWDALKQAAAQ